MGLVAFDSTILFSIYIHIFHIDIYTKLGLCFELVLNNFVEGI